MHRIVKKINGRICPIIQYNTNDNELLLMFEKRLLKHNKIYMNTI